MLVVLLGITNVDHEKSCVFPTNLHSFVSFGKTHKLHNAIDHWLAGVAGQAHVALDAVTKEERAVYTGHRGETGEGGTRRGKVAGKTTAEIWGHFGEDTGARRGSVDWRTASV